MLSKSRGHRAGRRAESRVTREERPCARLPGNKTPFGAMQIGDKKEKGT